jgi:hypothetical protein
VTALDILEQVKAEGVVLALVDDRLTWKSDHEPPAQLLEQIRTYRPEIIEVLTRPWLVRLARLLGCSPDNLLASGFFDRDDLIEQYQHSPWVIARLIQIHPAWRRPEFQPTPLLALSASVSVGAAGASAEWLAARDAFHNHALGQCQHCYPRSGRYCTEGAVLLARYQALK